MYLRNEYIFYFYFYFYFFLDSSITSVRSQQFVQCKRLRIIFALARARRIGIRYAPRISGVHVLVVRFGAVLFGLILFTI